MKKEELKKSLTREELVEKISSATGASKKMIKDIITQYENIILVDLVESREAKLGIIGKIKIKERAQRTGVDLSTNERIIIPAKLVPKFVFSKGVKEYIANKVK